MNGIASMHVAKAFFDVLYVNELQTIIAGPGGQAPLSSNVIEIYDCHQNKWNVIAAKTNYCYESVHSLLARKCRKQSFLWTDIENPFVINLCNGKDFAEFIDIRTNQRTWHKRTNLDLIICN